MQERNAMTNMDLKVYMESLKNNPRFTDAMLRLVEEDLKFGLTPEETEEYTAKKLDYTQMKVYSQCLRNGYGRDIRDIITGDGLTGEQMAVALEFYEKGVAAETVKEITRNTRQTAFVMKKLFQDVMEKLGDTQKNTGADGAYAGELLEKIRETVEKIEYQEKRYDALNEKLKELQAAKQEDAGQEYLQSQLADRDRLLESQQDQINAARAEIARLKNEIEVSEKERRVMERNKNPGSPNENENSSPYENPVVEKQAAGRDINKTAAPANDMAPPDTDNTMARHMEYRAALIDENGRIIQMVPIERMEKKKEGGTFGTLFSRLFLKRKMDVVKVVAESGLEAEQIVQVRSALEKGLTEKQLMVLINCRLPAEQMEEIIGIAVYENRTGRGE